MQHVHNTQAHIQKYRELAKGWNIFLSHSLHSKINESSNEHALWICMSRYILYRPEEFLNSTGLGTVLQEAQYWTKESRELLQSDNWSYQKQEAPWFCQGPPVDQEGVRWIQGQDQWSAWSYTEKVWIVQFKGEEAKCRDKWCYR